MIGQPLFHRRAKTIPARQHQTTLGPAENPGDGAKVFDLPWKKAYWAWGCLLLALLLWGAATFMERHPQYFLGF